MPSGRPLRAVGSRLDARHYQVSEVGSSWSQCAELLLERVSATGPALDVGGGGPSLWLLQAFSVSFRMGLCPPNLVQTLARPCTPSTLYNGTLYNMAKQVVFLKTASEHFFGLNLGMKQMDF